MFYKIPLDTDLSETSYRCYKETDEAALIEYNSGKVGESWKEITKEQAMEIAPEWFSSGSEESELTETEEAILNTAINTEYLVCLAELGL